MILKRIFLAIIIFCSSLAYSNQPNNGPSVINAKIFKADAHDLVYGKDDATIEVIEYFSLTCPHCENFFLNIFPDIKREYIDTGKVKWIKRSYAMDNASKKGTLLLYCVNKDEYEKYLAVLLTKQASWAYQKDPISILRNIATLGGISAKKFNDCQEDKVLQADIARIANEGSKLLKISGTPSFYINQEKVTLYSYKAFKDYFNKILSSSK